MSLKTEANRKEAVVLGQFNAKATGDLQQEIVQANYCPN